MKIVVYDPHDINVPYRVTEYNSSGHAADYDHVGYKIVDPDLSGVDGVPQHHWKFNGLDAVVEMTTQEKALAAQPLRETGSAATAEGLAATSSSEYKLRLSLTTSPLVNQADYVIWWYCEVSNSVPNSRTQVKIETTHEELNPNFSDEGDSRYIQVTNLLAEPSAAVVSRSNGRGRARHSKEVTDWIPLSGFGVIQGADVPITVNISFHKEDTKGSAYIQRVRAAVTRNIL